MSLNLGEIKWCHISFCEGCCVDSSDKQLQNTLEANTLGHRLLQSSSSLRSSAGV